MDSVWNDSHQKDKQLGKNLISNILVFLLKVLQGILFTPFLVRFLGIEVYGFVALAVSLTGYFNLITASVASSLSRYITIDIHQKNLPSANAFFNTSLLVMLLVAGPLLLLISILCIHVDAVFQVPAELKGAVGFLFFGVLVSFLVSMFGSIFSVSAYANNRLDICNFIEVSNISVRTGFIVVAFVLGQVALWLIGLAYVLGAFVAGCLSVVFWKRLTPFLKLRYEAVSRSIFKQLIGFSGWISIDQLGTLFLINCELILVNRFFGAAAGGEYALLLQWSSLLWAISAIFVNPLTPVIYSHYASSDVSAMISVCRKSLRYLGLIMALPVGLLCGFSRPLLFLWAGPEYIKLAPLLWLVVGHLVVNLAVTPLFAINRAYNSLQLPALVTGFTGLGCIVLAIWLAYYTEWGMYGVAVAVAVMLSGRNLLFVPWYSGRLLGISGRVLLSELIPGVFGTILVVLIATGLNTLSQADSWLWLGLQSVGVSLCYVVLASALLPKTQQFAFQAAIEMLLKAGYRR